MSSSKIIRVDWAAWAVTAANMRAVCGAKAFREPSSPVADGTPRAPSEPPYLPGMAQWLARHKRTGEDHG